MCVCVCVCVDEWRRSWFVASLFIGVAGVVAASLWAGLIDITCGCEDSIILLSRARVWAVNMAHACGVYEAR